MAKSLCFTWQNFDAACHWFVNLHAKSHQNGEESNGLRSQNHQLGADAKGRWAASSGEAPGQSCRQMACLLSDLCAGAVGILASGLWGSFAPSTATRGLSQAELLRTLINRLDDVLLRLLVYTLL